MVGTMEFHPFSKVVYMLRHGTNIKTAPSRVLHLSGTEPRCESRKKKRKYKQSPHQMEILMGKSSYINGTMFVFGRNTEFVVSVDVS